MMILSVQQAMGANAYLKVRHAWNGLHDAMRGKSIRSAVQDVNVRQKMKGLAMSLELAVVIVVITLLIAGAAYAGMMLLKRGKISATQTELDQLRTSVLVYTATSSTGRAPTDLNFLINGYTDQAGMLVKDKLPQRWQDNGIIDSWGQPYTITLDSNGINGVISSPGVPGENTPISVTF